MHQKQSVYEIKDAGCHLPVSVSTYSIVNWDLGSGEWGCQFFWPYLIKKIHVDRIYLE